MEISFLLNGETVVADANTGTETLLYWLREAKGLAGTKEGCNEGDCGACSVIVTGSDGVPRAMNSCIMFLPQIQGKSIQTVEGVSGPEGDLHPIQQEMINHHGSQCGYCTPGFITTMVAAHSRGDTDHDLQLSGNLCRCTGYAPIVRAAAAARAEPPPQWIKTAAPKTEIVTQENIFCPQSSDALAAWYAAHPDGTLIAGGTDVGLWVTKSLADLGPTAFLGHVADLNGITQTPTHWVIGATTTIDHVNETLREQWPSLGEMLDRYGSPQVRNAATIGGNIANGSPIGDSPPALIALGSTLVLRQGDTRRDILLEDFFIDYGKQDRRPGEFVETIHIPKEQPNLRCYKISKRFDQDISALCGCFNVTLRDGIVVNAKLAFGGMAGIPKRARHVENFLMGQPWSIDVVSKAITEIDRDFTPLSDMRASKDYRLRTAKNLLIRYFHDLAGLPTHVQKVTA